MRTVYDLCVEVGLEMTVPQKHALRARTVEIDHGPGRMPSLSGEWTPVKSFEETYRSPKRSSLYEGGIVVWSHMRPNNIMMVHHFLADGTVKSGMMA
jgi:hypothetical protein